MTEFGIDVSKHNGVIDWETASKNIDFAIIRGGYSTKIDTRAEYNCSECDRLDIPYGVYWFSYATNLGAVEREANKCLEFLSGVNPTLPIFFDFEYDSIRYAEEQGVKVTQEMVRAFTETFCEIIKAKGYSVGFYANTDWVKRWYGEEYVNNTKYTFWLAHWGSKQKRKHDLWQYTDSGKVEGIKGVVDCNYRYIDKPTLTVEIKKG